LGAIDHVGSSKHEKVKVIYSRKNNNSKQSNTATKQKKISPFKKFDLKKEVTEGKLAKIDEKKLRIKPIRKME